LPVISARTKWKATSVSMNRSRSPIASRLAASLFASCSICAAVASYDGAKEVMAAILREVVAVAKAQGMALDYDERSGRDHPQSGVRRPA
jgi:hypothetical protein